MVWIKRSIRFIK